ncbi:hypothetical protein C7974DRAFT_388677 [Boeremia exigua]|uniref:uncharacterized protein n=1 Tax=Boeremia exigua TaxID=749465 RepID=UPI001E8D0971|nr:uncharacterized protein C7974DRAFT_388677 [Boeremia exigua]KAH6639514.1 hypothetical protein C7974DRAFT_388677 [Boeremia exigua]
MLAETAQIEELQRQWEGVIAEIFQLGSACLGEIDIATLLSTANVDASATSPASKAESSLFVPEHDDSAKGGAKRKRVSFDSSGLLASFPAFLFRAPEHQKQVPAAPDLPAGGIQRFEKDISGLGKQHTADLHRLEKEHKAWWTKKQQQLANTFRED